MNSTSDTFIDEATISVSAGDGGDGRVSLRREKFVPRGGPDGGNGGRGGNVVLVADRNLATLVDQRLKRKNHAEAGAPGGSRNRYGRNGADLEIRLPVGTLVYDTEAARGAAPVVDLTRDGQRTTVARGGRGGRGNTEFKTATRQTPDFAEDGRAGKSRRLRLSLKLLADVGLIGLPNAGKSTLLRCATSARPRVAAYPFTTLTPALGVAEVGERRFVMADVPGLIRGASEGAGLGDRFLRHVERTRVLIHVLDAGALVLEDRDLLESWEAIRSELGRYAAGLLERTELVALNKVDLVSARRDLDAVEAALEARGCRVFRTSGATGEGVEALLRAAAGTLDAGPDTQATGMTEARA